MSVVVMGESNDQAGEECVLCMQSALTLTAREGSRSHTRTGHAIVALVTASDRSLPIVSVRRAR